MRKGWILQRKEVLRKKTKERLIESWFYMEVNILNKTLSIIYAETYDDSWGSTIEVFGIADNEEDVEKICNSVKKEGYYAQIETVTLNEYCRRYLGGYYE